MSHFTTVRTDLDRMSESIAALRHDHGFGYHQIAAWAERLAITQALNEAQGVKLKAARSLGLNRVTLDRKIEAIGLWSNVVSVSATSNTSHLRTSSPSKTKTTNLFYLTHHDHTKTTPVLLRPPQQTGVFFWKKKIRKKNKTPSTLPATLHCVTIKTDGKETARYCAV